MLNTVHFSRGKPDFGTDFSSGLVLQEQGVAPVVAKLELGVVFSCGFGEKC